MSLWESVASEPGAADMAMFEPGSWFVDAPTAALAPETAAAYRAEARPRNDAGTAGRAGIYLRAPA
jgi:hypothetical protein